MKEIITACVLFLVSAGLFVVSFRSFREKGFLFNNAYIYASKQERERMNKRPYYHQSAVIFSLLGLSFVSSGAELLFGLDWLFWLTAVILAATIVYAIVSTVMLQKR